MHIIIQNGNNDSIAVVEHEDDSSAESVSSGSGRRNGETEGWVRPPRKSSSRRSRHRKRDASAEKSSSFRGAGNVPSSGSGTGTGTKTTGRTVANGLKLAQTQAIAVAGFLADVDSRQWRVCDTCFSHRASYHGRGDQKINIKK